MIPDLRSSAAATEFKECLYQNQVTVHCQAHDRCLDCEGCEECKQFAGERIDAQNRAEQAGEIPLSPSMGNRRQVSCGSAATAVGAERGNNPVVAQAPPAGRAVCPACYCGMHSQCIGQGCYCHCYDLEEDDTASDPDPFIPTFDEEYGVHYRGRIHSGMVNA